MNTAYTRRNLENLKKGDTLKIVSVYTHSKNHLTIGNNYKVLAVKVDDNEERYFRNKFLIETDTGDKRWYKFKNNMFEKVDEDITPVGYTENHLQLIKQFTDTALMFQETYLNGDVGKPSFESEIAILQDEYLIKLLNCESKKSIQKREEISMMQDLHKSVPFSKEDIEGAVEKYNLDFNSASKICVSAMELGCSIDQVADVIFEFNKK